jgi:Domain of unknown function (DUF4911)
VNGVGRDGNEPGLDTIFLRIDPVDIAFVKFVVEAYEGVAVVRTLDRRAAVIVLLVSRDFRPVADSILAALRDSTRFEEVPVPDGAREDWLLRILWEES